LVHEQKREKQSSTYKQNKKAIGSCKYKQKAISSLKMQSGPANVRELMCWPWRTVAEHLDGDDVGELVVGQEE
jgi:hypothetical protein